MDVDETSDKVQSAVGIPNSEKSEFKLPRLGYQPFFVKAMQDFISHHNLPKHLTIPAGNMHISDVFSYILDIMAHSMGDEKRKNLIKELEEYNPSLPSENR